MPLVRLRLSFFGTLLDIFLTPFHPSLLVHTRRCAVQWRPSTCRPISRALSTFEGWATSLLPSVPSRWMLLALHQLPLTYTCGGVHPRRVEPASPIELTMLRTETLQARRSCASPIETFIQSFLHLAVGRGAS